MDGIYTFCPKLFKQLYTIHGYMYVSNKQQMRNIYGVLEQMIWSPWQNYYLHHCMARKQDQHMQLTIFQFWNLPSLYIHWVVQAFEVPHLLLIWHIHILQRNRCFLLIYGSTPHPTWKEPTVALNRSIVIIAASTTQAIHLHTRHTVSVDSFRLPR
jgi:hypothetical protein